MRVLIYFGIGILFGIVMYKSEAASWFRIYEMFTFGSFHMYGIIGTALIVGILGVQLLKVKKVKTMQGNSINFKPKEKRVPRYLFGGIIFGLGWALAGACPGPIYVLLGAGYFPILVVVLGALLGTYFYGYFRDKLPH
ncbi:YeeE/YedE family protein [Flavobacteriaceae bacterium F08102]|nr:YeeE/YedE family protein [Flavobacteriaceae bacterium F08102]